MSDLSLFAPKTIRGFAAVYALLALVVLAAICGPIAILQMAPLKHDVKAVQKVIGNTDAVRAAEANVAAEAQKEGLTLTSQKITKVVQDPKDPNTVKVYDSIGTVEAGPIDLVITLSNGVWTVANVAVVQ